MSGVIVKFGADTSDLKDGIKSAMSAVDGFGSQIVSTAQSASLNFGELSSTISEAASSSSDFLSKLSIVTAAAPAAVATALGAVTGIAVSTGTEIQNAANQLGTSTEVISKFAPVAAAAGLSVQDFANKFATLDDKLRKGDTAAKNALKALRIDPAAFHAEEASQQIQTVMNALSGLQDNFAKTAAAQAIFGSSAEGMIAAATRATSSLGSLGTEADRTGTAISTQLAARIAGTGSILDQIGANFREAGEAVKGLAITVYNELKPAIDYFLQAFSSSVASIAKWIESINDATRAGSGLHGALATIRDALLNVAAGMAAFTTTAIEAFTRLGPIAVKVFEDIRTAGMGIWSDIGGVVQRFWEALNVSATESIRTISLQFAGLGNVIAAALHGNLDGVKSGLNDIAEASGRAAQQTNLAWAKVLPPGASAGIEAAKVDLTNLGKDGADIAAHISQNFTEAYDKIQNQWSHPIVTPKVNNPSAGDMPGPAKAADTDAIRAAQVTIEGEIQAAKLGLDQKKALYEQDVAYGRMSEQQKLAAVKVADEEEYQTELALLKKLAAIEGQKPAAREAALNKINALEMSHATQVIEINTQTAKAVVDQYKSAFEQIGSSISSQINSMLAGQEKFDQAVKKVAASIIESFIAARIKSVADWAAGQAAQLTTTITTEASKTAAVTAGETARSGVIAAGSAAQSGSVIGAMVTQVLADAKLTIAGVTAFLAPVLGPAAPAEAATVGSGVLALAGGLAVGAWSLPSDMIVQAHAGEMVVPAGVTPFMQGLASSAAGGGASSGAGGGWTGDLHVNIQMPANGMWTQQQANAMGPMIAKAFAAQFTSNPSIRKAMGLS